MTINGFILLLSSPGLQNCCLPRFSANDLYHPAEQREGCIPRKKRIRYFDLTVEPTVDGLCGSGETCEVSGKNIVSPTFLNPKAMSFQDGFGLSKGELPRMN